ncbi:phasin family protein [Schlegelella sp. S2-27]|uniref:Phasin family protein n=1 Tax=Caldimonas mangrovi TaxID=2944811 RepID=A0ABT0YPD5_9BURK|nr:phasin family protein [Caldimonas mangrovi]MCM5680576.1 phasin family protein [Caldimonas mangrovi]
MPSKTAKPSPARATAASVDVDAWTRAGKQQLAWSIDLAAALFKGAETMRRAQLNAAHLARVRHENVAERLSEARDLASVMALQAELLRFDMAGAARYWQELFDLGLRTGVEMLGCTGRAMEPGDGDGAKSAWQMLHGLTQTGIGTIDDLFGTTLNQATKAGTAPTQRPAAH